MICFPLIIAYFLVLYELPSEEQKKQMGDFIKKKYGAGDIKWVMAEDKALIGGFILQVDGKEYDYSVQGRLNRLERKLTN